MHLRLHTFLSRFGYELAGDLEARGLGTVEVHTGPTTAFELRHKPTVSGGDVAKLLEALKPLQPGSVLPDPDLDGADVVLNLGDEHALNAWEVRIDSDSPDLAGRVGATRPTTWGSAIWGPSWACRTPIPCCMPPPARFPGKCCAGN
jgi:hypothetical protein